MHVEIRPPDQVRVWMRRREPAPSSAARMWFELAARGVALGFGVGLLLVVGTRAMVAELAIVGVVAIAAALLSWEA
jgi:hypothetical protein